MKLQTIIMVLAGLFLLGRNKLNEWADRITISIRGIKPQYFRFRLLLIPEIEINNPTPAAINVTSSTTTIKYKGQEIAKSVDNIPIIIPANSTATLKPKVAVNALNTSSAIFDLAKGGKGAFTYSGTLYTKAGAIPWSYTDTTTMGAINYNHLSGVN